MGSSFPGSASTSSGGHFFLRVSNWRADGTNGVSGEYPTEQQGMSNFQVKSNVNDNVSGGWFASAVRLSPLTLTWKLDIPCCSVGY
jgi:hypothetical protein